MRKTVPCRLNEVRNIAKEIQPTVVGAVFIDDFVRGTFIVGRRPVRTIKTSVRSSSVAGNCYHVKSYCFELADCFPYYAVQ